MVGRLWLKGYPEPPCPHKVKDTNIWREHTAPEKCMFLKKLNAHSARRGYFFLSYGGWVEPERDRWSLDVEEGKLQEGCVVEGWCQDGLEEGQALLAELQILCTVYGTRLKHENMNAGLDSRSLFHLIQLSPFLQCFRLAMTNLK